MQVASLSLDIIFLLFVFYAIPRLCRDVAQLEVLEIIFCISLSLII
jgi:hypothetical protein